MKFKSLLTLVVVLPLFLFSLENSIVDSMRTPPVLNKYSADQKAAITKALEQRDTAIRIASFNILFDLYDYNLPTEYRWPNRLPRVAAVIDEMSPDLLGVQELYPNQRDDLLNHLGETYAFYAKPEADGELNGIFYKKERFEVLDSHIWYLKEQGGGTLTMLKLKDKVSQKALAFFNCHLAFGKMEKRVTQAKRINRFIKAYRENNPDTPLALTGDFNSFPNRPDLTKLPFYDGDYTESLLKDGLFVDARDHAIIGHIGPYGTFTNLGEDPTPFKGTGTPGIFLDHIYVSPDVTVLIHAVNPAQVDGLFPSDHMPLLADIQLKETP